MNTAACKGCDQPIVWASTEKNGKPIPMDAVPDPNGNLVIVGERRDGTPIVRTLSKAERSTTALFGDEDRYLPHHASCSHVEDFR